MTPQRVAIIGSRPHPGPARIHDRNDMRRLAVRDYVGNLPAGTVVISGGAQGVDLWAEERALQAGLVVVRCIPPWDALGKRAGMVRNAVIVDLCDRLAAFWDGESRGTKNAIEAARKAGKPVEVFR